MIRADVLRKLGWSTSITEDWELTIRLYLAGYKVLYTPYIQAPAECVSTVRRLIRQRMRWAEGHTYNVKKYFFKVLRSPNLTWREKLEFVYYAPYYMQSVLLGIGTVAWLVSEFALRAPLPAWTALLGWSLVFTNLLALPLMNFAAIALEGSFRRDAAGIVSAAGLSMLLVPFQAYAALRGVIEREEGDWMRTPKSGRITEAIGRLRLSRILPWELPRRQRAATAGGAVRRVALRPGPSHRGALAALALVLLALLTLAGLAREVPVVLANPDVLYLHDTSVATGKGMDTTIGGGLVNATIPGNSALWWFTTATYPTGGDDGAVAAGDYTLHLYVASAPVGNSVEMTAAVCDQSGSPCTTIVQRACAAVSTVPGMQTFTLGTTSSPTTISGPANSKRIALELRTCDSGSTIIIRYDTTTIAGADSNLAIPAVTVPDTTLWLAPLALVLPLLLRSRVRRARSLA
jgi:hypothetical protein